MQSNMAIYEFRESERQYWYLVRVNGQYHACDELPTHLKDRLSVGWDVNNQEHGDVIVTAHIKQGSAKLGPVRLFPPFTKEAAFEYDRNYQLSRGVNDRKGQ